MSWASLVRKSRRTNEIAASLSQSSTYERRSRAGRPRFALGRFEPLENRHLLSINYVDDNYQIDVDIAPSGLSQGDTVTFDVGGPFQQAGLVVHGPLFPAGTAFSSINAAIAASSDGDTIRVARGSYPENVVVDKDVTLEGANVAISPNTGVRVSPESSVGNLSGASFTVTGSGSGASIIGFRLVNPTGVELSDGGAVDGVTIEKNLFVSSTTGILDADGDAGTGLAIVDNRFNTVGAAIVLSAYSSPLIDANVVNGGGSGIAMQLSDLTGGTVSNNEVLSTSSGALSLADSTTVAVSGNTFTDNGAGAVVELSGDLTDTLLSGNVISRTGAPTAEIGVQMAVGSSGATVTGGSITNFDRGLNVEGSATIDAVAIDGNNIGLRAAGSVALEGVLFGAAAAADNTIDLLVVSGATGVTLGAPSSFNATQSFIENYSTLNIDAIGQGLNAPNNFRIEDKIVHRMDDTVALSVGLVTWVAGERFVTDAGTDSSIQRGVDAALAGDTIHVEAGTYDEVVAVNKSVALVGAGGTATTVTRSAGSDQTLFTVSADDVTIADFHLLLNRPVVTAGIAAFNPATFDDLTIVGNTIEATGAGGSFANPYIATSAVGIALLGSGTGFESAVIQGNTITATPPTSAVSRGIWLREVNALVGGPSASDGNQIGATTQDLLAQFVSGGTTTVQNNTFYGAGVDFTEPNSAAPVDILDNQFLPVSPLAPQSLLIKHNYSGSPVLVSGNTFTGHNVGIYSGGSGNVTVDGNEFTPASGSTTFRHVVVNTGWPGTIAGTLNPNSIALTSNLFHDSGVAGGTGIQFSNGLSTTIDPDFSSIVVGAAGQENDFEAGHARFIELNVTAPHGTSIVPFDFDIDARHNRFDVGGGLATPAAMTLADRFALEDKLQHAVDAGSLGFITVVPGQVFVTPNSFIAPTTTTPSVQRGIDAATAGDTVHVAAGLYPNAVNVNKYVTIDGAGSGSNPSVDTVLQPAAGNVLITASGLGASQRLTLQDLRVTSTSGIVHGVLASGVAHLALLNVASVDNDGDGFQLANIDDLVMTDIVATGNGQAAPPTTGRGIGLNGVRDAVLTNVTASGNYSSGLSIGARNGSTGDSTNLTIDGGVFSNNVGAAGASGINVYISDADPGSLVDGVTVQGIVDASDNAFGGITLFSEGVTGLISNVAVGQMLGDAVQLTGNSQAGLIVFGPVNDVDVKASFDLDGEVLAAGVVVLGLNSAGAFSPTNVRVDGSDFTGYSHALPAITLATYLPADLRASTNVSAADVTINGLSANSPSLGDHFDLEDLVLHGVDVAVAGTVIWNPGHTYVTPDSYEPLLGTTSARVQRGIDAATAGDIVHVEAATYADNFTINKLVHLRGSNAGDDPRDGWANPATVLTTALDAANTAVVATVAASGSGSTIDGFEFDGDNLALSGGVLQGGAEINAARGISALNASGLQVVNNRIKNFQVFGVYLDGLSGDLLVEYNQIDNILGQSGVGFGVGVVLANNAYGAVHQNEMTAVRRGVQTNNMHLANPGAAAAITDNEIDAGNLGIFHNLQYGSASGFVITGNTLTSSFTSSIGSASDPLNAGLALISLATGANTISGNSLSGQYHDGIVVWNSQTPLLISGGSIDASQMTRAAVRVENVNVVYGNASPGAASVTLSGVPILDAENGVQVVDLLGATHALNVALLGGTSVDGASSIGVEVTGSGASATLSGVLVSDFTTGIQVSNGATLTLGAGNQIVGGVTGLRIDAAFLAGHTFNNTAFAGQSGQYIELAGGAEDDNDLDATAASFDGLMGGTVADGLAIEAKLFHEVDLGSVGFIELVDSQVYVPALTSGFTPTYNNYRILANVADNLTNGVTVHLDGLFDWTEANALADWATGNDGLVDGAYLDDYSLRMPGGVSGVTWTSTALGAAKIQGPGDLPHVDLEGTFYFDGSGDNKNWEISNLQIFEFDLGIGMFYGAAGVDAYDNMKILNNHILLPTDLNDFDNPLDAFQNIAIHLGFGANQLIQGNTIDIPGNGFSNDANDGTSASVALQGNTSGGAVYDGLVIDSNVVNILFAQSSDPEYIRGIWENSNGTTSNIQVTNNQFNNLGGGNDAALNRQIAFRATSPSSATTTVTYQGNYVGGANTGFAYYPGYNNAGTFPVQFIGNTAVDVFFGFNFANAVSVNLLSDNSVSGLGGAGIGINVGPGTVLTLDDSVDSNDVSGFLAGVRVAGSATISGNATTISGNIVGIDVDGGSAAIIGNTIVDNQTGIRFINGGAGSVAGNLFDGALDNLTDLFLASSAGAVTIGAGNSFAGDTFFIDNHSMQDYDLTGIAAFDESNDYRIEDKMHHVVDTDLALTTGLITWLTGQVFVTDPSVLGTTDSSIQRGVHAAPAGGTVNVEQGYFVENVLVNKNLTLLSESGRAGTTIEGISGLGALGTIVVTNSTTAFKLGGPAGQGFTIIGLDNNNPGIENAAVYLQGGHANAEIRWNEIVAAGDHGFASEFGAAVTFLTVDNNIFSGQTFIGVPADNGFANQFTTPNVPRQLFVLGSGAGTTVSNNITFTNNQIVGTAGGVNGGGEQGNTLVTLDALNSIIIGNTFNGTTTRFADSLRARGAGNLIQDNQFVSGAMGAMTRDLYVNRSGNVIEGNTFSSSAGSAIIVDSSGGAIIGGPGPAANSITGYPVGVLVTGTGAASLLGNTITGSTLAGVSVTNSAVALLEGNDLTGNAIGLLAQNSAKVDAGQVGTAVNYTGLGVSGGGNDFSGYLSSSPTSGAIVNLVAVPGAGPQGLASGLDLSARGNTFPANVEAAIYHDHDDNSLGWVVAQAPSIDTLAVDATVFEGGTVTLTGTYSSDNASNELDIDWDGDGLYDETIVLAGGSFNVLHTYDDDAPTGTPSDLTTINVRIRDLVSLNEDVDSTTTTVINVDPILGLVSVTPNVDEGGTVTLSGTYSDVGVLDTHELDIDWDGDGLFDEIVTVSGGTFNVLHTYVDDDPTGTPSDLTTINVRLRDDDTGFDTAATATTVHNVPPTSVAIVGAPVSSPEGTLISLTPSFVDPAGSNDTYTYAWSVTKNSFPYASQTGPTPGFSFTPDDNGSYVVSLTITDDDTGSGSATPATITVTNVAPSIALSGAASVDEASIYTLTLGAITDPGADTVTQWIVNWGDGDIETFFSGGPVTHVYADGPALRNITVSLLDEDGLHNNVGLPSPLQVTVNNVAPTASFANTGPFDEGSTGFVLFFGQDDVSTPDDLAGFTYSYDFNNDGDFLDAGEIASTSSPSAVVPAIYLADGPMLRTVRGRIRDKDGGFTDYFTTFTVNNVAPIVNAGPDGAAGVGSPFIQAGSFIDPGADTWTATVDYDDGNGVQPLPLSGHNFTLNVTYATTGLKTITVTVADDDGDMHTDTVLVNVTPTRFQVVGFTPNPSGFDVQFNRAADVSVLNLYDGPDLAVDLPDVTVVGANTGPVRGSLVWNAATNTASFVRTGGVLLADTYTVTLVSASDAWQDLFGEHLDGNFDNIAGDNYTNAFVVGVSSDRVLSLPDFARGPYQPVDVPATSAGLPIRISNGLDVGSIDVDIHYDPALLTITAANLAAGMPVGWSITSNLTVPGLAEITISTGTSPLPAGARDVITLTADVPGSATYGLSQVLRLENVLVGSFFSGTIPTKGDRAVHKAAFLGDADGSGSPLPAFGPYDGNDAALISRVVVNLDTGFDAHDSVDPAIVANTNGLTVVDVHGEPLLDGQDASFVAQKSVLLARPEIPDWPLVPVGAVPAGVDPALDIPDLVPGAAGSSVSTGVDIDVADGLLGFNVRTDYVTSLLNLATGDVLLGSFFDGMGGWSIVANANDAIGQVNVSLFRSTPVPMGSGGGQVVEYTFDILPSAPAGVTDLLLSGVPNSGGFTYTHADGSILIHTAPRLGPAAVTMWGSASVHPPYTVPTGNGEQLRTVPVANVDTISITFPEDVIVTLGDLAMSGVNFGAYTFTGFSYNPLTFTATWTLPSPIGADKLTLTLSDNVTDLFGAALDGEWDNPTDLNDPSSSTLAGDGIEGGDFVFHFTVLPGDANRDNKVTGADFTIWNDSYDDGAGPADKLFTDGDFTGDGHTTGADYTVWADHYNFDQTAPPVDFGGIGGRLADRNEHLLLAPLAATPAIAAAPSRADSGATLAAPLPASRRANLATADLAAIDALIGAQDWLHDDLTETLANHARNRRA